jgi:hypothetical protein
MNTKLVESLVQVIESLSPEDYLPSGEGTGNRQRGTVKI